MAYPSSLDSLSTTRGTASDTLSAVNHVTHHTTEDTAIEALEAKVGVDGSAVTTTHDYKLSGVTGSDKAASKTGTETLTNKTLTAPVINAGSDATGDIYYRSAGGVFTRLAIGSNTQILQSNGTIPAWVANPSASNGSTTVAGIFEAATAAQVTAGTATGETGAALAVTPDALASSAPTFSGANLTSLPSTLVAKNGATTHDMSTTTTTTIAHGLGKTPKLVKIHVNRSTASSAGITGSLLSSVGSYDGSTQNCNYVAVDSNGSVSMSGQDTSNGVHYGYGAAGTADTDKLTGVITFDATNITITWTKTNSPTGTGDIHWEALG